MINLTLVTPTKKYFANEPVDEVIVPAFQGEISILDGHSPLMTTLNAGILKFKLKGESEYQRLVLSWGYCEVNPTGVTILTETCETASEVDKARAEEAMKKSNAKLLEKGITPDLIEKYQRKLRRAEARLSI